MKFVLSLLRSTVSFEKDINRHLKFCNSILLLHPVIRTPQIEVIRQMSVRLIKISDCMISLYELECYYSQPRIISQHLPQPYVLGVLRTQSIFVYCHWSNDFYSWVSKASATFGSLSSCTGIDVPFSVVIGQLVIHLWRQCFISLI